MRSRKQPVIFVRVGFEPGYIDVLSRSARIDHLKEMKAMVIGEFGTEFPVGFSPLPGELVITKRAVNPFHNTNLLGCCSVTGWAGPALRESVLDRTLHDLGERFYRPGEGS